MDVGVGERGKGSLEAGQNGHDEECMGERAGGGAIDMEGWGGGGGREAGARHIAAGVAETRARREDRSFGKGCV